MSAVNVDNATIGTELTQIDSTFVAIDINGDAPVVTEKTQDVNGDTVVTDVENAENVDVANQKRIASKTLFIGVFIIVLIVIAFAIWRTVVIFS